MADEEMNSEERSSFDLIVTNYDFDNNPEIKSEVGSEIIDKADIAKKR
jgi:hypothetical protein